MSECEEIDYRPHGFLTLLGEFFFLKDREAEIAPALLNLDFSYSSRAKAIEAIRRVLPESSRREVEAIASVIRVAPADFGDDDA